MQVVCKDNKDNKYFMPDNLKDTVDLMCSEFYFERIIGEYFQLRIRIHLLNDLINSVGERNYPRLVEQRFCMISYANILGYRLKLIGYTIEEY